MTVAIIRPIHLNMIFFTRGGLGGGGDLESRHNVDCEVFSLRNSSIYVAY